MKNDNLNNPYKKNPYTIDNKYNYLGDPSTKYIDFNHNKRSLSDINKIANRDFIINSLRKNTIYF